MMTAKRLWGDKMDTKQVIEAYLERAATLVERIEHPCATRKCVRYGYMRGGA
jgi:hypothetical protein